MDNTSNKPRDFFVHLSAFAVLYFIVIALVTLLFTLIDYRFPDVLNNYYVDPYSGPVRFSIATLITLSPLFVYLMRKIQKETRANADRAKLGVRKWLTYITLFVAGATVAADVITLLYSFLGGSLATAFALKALTLFVLATVIFWYFFMDLRGYWLSKAKESWMVAYAFLGIIVASIALGFAVMGSPSAQRQIRFDEERRASLESIQSQVVSYWQNNQKLPTELSALDNPLQYFTVPTDPETGASYEYSVKDALSFEICATFARESSTERKGEYYPVSYGLKDGNSWKHDAGRTCFTRTIDTNLIKPIPAMEAKTVTQ